MSLPDMKVGLSLKEIQKHVHAQSAGMGWWNNTDVDAAVPGKLCLIHSEISEAMEGHRKSLPDDKLPHRLMVEVELADAVIRILDLAGALGLDIESALVEKSNYNLRRADHQPAARAAEHGKKY